MPDRMGFTGSRNQPTVRQILWLNGMIDPFTELHHGVCVGSDAVAHEIALANHASITAHPPTDTRLMSESSLATADDVREAKPYLERNKDIVDETEYLVALPDGPEYERSGTWSTVRYAVGVGKPVSICYPDGTVEER